MRGFNDDDEDDVVEAAAGESAVLSEMLGVDEGEMKGVGECGGTMSMVAWLLLLLVTPAQRPLQHC